MMDASQLAEVIETYRKHGWVLRRVLLSDASRVSISSGITALLGDVPVVSGPVDAAWFSRPPARGPVTWELRYLGNTAFALLEQVDESEPGADEARAVVEQRLANAIESRN